MRRVLFLLALVLNVSFSAGLSAQDRFELEKRGGHYYFTSAIGDSSVELMMESGIPALLVGQNIYESCLKTSGLSFEPSKRKIRLLNNLYDILYRAEGEVRIGNVLYEGPVFVLKDYDAASVPVQYLKDPVSRRAVLTIDLENNYLLVGETGKKSAGKKFRLSFDKKLGFPVVDATVRLLTPDGRSRLKGDLIVDFGNPSLIFMLKQHESIAKALNKKTIELKDAFDPQGRLVAQGIWAEEVSLFGRRYNDMSIGVTERMKSLEQLGFLGTRFFTSPVVFDFDKGVMVIRCREQRDSHSALPRQ